jgi:hypothetical protein
MKLQLVETMDTSGSWFYIYNCETVDGKEVRTLLQCIGLKDRTREEALEIADRLMGFYAENKGKERIIKEFEYIEI